MEYERKAVNITWQIENVKHIRLYQRLDLYSSLITSDSMEGTKWKLGVRRVFSSSILLTLKRAENDDGPKLFELQYTFVTNSILSQEKLLSYTFQKGQRCPRLEVALPKSYNQLSPDTIVIRCKIWKLSGSIPKSEHFFSLTRLCTERKIFRNKFQNVSSYSGCKNIVLRIQSNGGSAMEIKFVFSRKISLFESDYCTEMRMKIISLDYRLERFCNVKMYLLDTSRNITGIGKFDKEFILAPSVERDFLVVSNKTFKENAVLYSENDVLSFFTVVTFSPGINYEEVQRIENVQDSDTELQQTEFSNSVKCLASIECIAFDTKLRTVSETFPARFLSNQSPVFEAMFKTNTKRAVQKCFFIDDVDADTLKHMLMFLHFNQLDELDWKSAMKLYMAANEYQVLSLKQKCSDILKRTIGFDNCCVLFYIADIYQDEILKSSTQNYIALYGREVLNCDQWKKLEKNHPRLIIDFFREQYLEKSLFKI